MLYLYKDMPQRCGELQKPILKRSNKKSEKSDFMDM